MPPNAAQPPTNAGAEKRQHRSPSYRHRQARRLAAQIEQVSRTRHKTQTNGEANATTQHTHDLGDLFVRKQITRHELRDELYAAGYRPWEDEKYFGRTSALRKSETPTGQVRASRKTDGDGAGATES